jgi:gluconokinase
LRIRQREGHFMPASLLDSQLATLERLGPDEPGTTLDAVDPPDGLADRLIELLRLGP